MRFEKKYAPGFFEMKTNKRRYLNNHIALFFPSFRIGGTERVMVHLLHGFINKGLIVDAVVINAQGPFRKELPSGVNLVDLGSKRALTSLLPFISYLYKNHPEAVLSAATRVNIIAILAVLFSRKSIRLVVSERSYLTQKKKYSSKFWDKLSHQLIKLLYPYADSVVTVSQDANQDFMNFSNLDPKKITTIYNPVPVDYIQKAANEKIFHPWLETSEVPVILAVGRLSRPKNYPLLIDAFNILRQRRKCRLLIIGEGEERAKIQQLVQSSTFTEDIWLLGKTDNPYPYMARADVFVLSSSWEGFSNVLVEALACGATVVSTDCHSSPAEILQNGKFGRLVPEDDATALADAIEVSLDHPMPSKQSIKRAQQFSVEKAVQKYLQLLLPEN